MPGSTHHNNSAPGEANLIGMWRQDGLKSLYWGGRRIAPPPKAQNSRQTEDQIWERSDPSQHHLLVLPRRRAPRPRCRFLSFAMNRNSRYRPHNTTTPIASAMDRSGSRCARVDQRSSQNKRRHGTICARSDATRAISQRPQRSPLGEGPMLRCKLAAARASQASASQAVLYTTILDRPRLNSALVPHFKEYRPGRGLLRVLH